MNKAEIEKEKREHDEYILNADIPLKPAITVLLTVYNGEEYIRDTIQSVLNQTFTNFEFIIVNDGSTDNTKKIIKSFDDKRIIYLEKKNEGYYNLDKAINKGLEIAKGEYIARIDADDIWYRNKLRVQYEYLKDNEDIFLIGTSAEVIDKYGNIIDRIIKKNYPSILYKLYVAFSNSFIHSSIMFRNDKSKYPSYNEHLFYFYMIYLGKKIKNIPQILVQYRINPKGMMSKEADLSKNKYRGLYKNHS